MLKKLLSLFIIILLSISNLLGYFYDNLVISYDSNSTSSTRIVNLSKKDREIISTLSKEYNYNDGSKTILSIKGLKISKSQIDFITNGKGMLNSFVNNTKNYIKNKDFSPKRVYVLTSISNTKNVKEKLAIDLDFSSILSYFYIVTGNTFEESISSKNPDLFVSARAPPVYYILNQDIIC